MAMASPSSSSLTVMEVCHLLPSSEGNQISFPLTSFDTLWIKSFPVERLFFFETPHFASSDIFFDSVLPKLKASFSATLSHFLPLAGNLLWPLGTAKPFLNYSPGDAVTFTVAEFSDAAAFDRLAGDAPRPAVESRPLVPRLTVSEFKAPAMAVQLTFFSDKGLCIGLTCHHAVLDGPSSTMFMKAWAHIFRNSDTVTLPPELSPVFDRGGFRDPEGLDMVFLNYWVKEAESLSDPNPKSLKLLDEMKFPEDLLRATFRLTREDINKLKNKLISEGKSSESRSFSTFVTTCAYVMISMVKATDPERAFFMFAANFRRRVNPPVPVNFVGNCIGLGGIMEIENRDLPSLAEKIRDKIKEMEKKKDVMEGAEKWLEMINDAVGRGRVTGVAGSPLLRAYETDFGWGKPKKVEITSIDRNGSISLAENGDDNNGGVEVGLVLKKEEMKMFDSIFHMGLL